MKSLFLTALISSSLAIPLASFAAAPDNYKTSGGAAVQRAIVVEDMSIEYIPGADQILSVNQGNNVVAYHGKVHNNTDNVVNANDWGLRAGYVGSQGTVTTNGDISLFSSENNDNVLTVRADSDVISLKSVDDGKGWVYYQGKKNLEGKSDTDTIRFITQGNNDLKPGTYPMTLVAVVYNN